MSGNREESRLPAEPDDPTDEPPPSSSSQSVHGEPITVMLVDKAAGDLQITHERTNMSKTDIVNRAISLYEFVDDEIRTGAELIIRRNGQDYLVKLM